MRPEDYLKSRGQVAIRQQIIEAVSDGLKVPDVFLKAVALYRGEDRTADYIVHAPAPRSAVGDPGETCSPNGSTARRDLRGA